MGGLLEARQGKSINQKRRQGFPKWNGNTGKEQNGRFGLGHCAHVFSNHRGGTG
jgi:hypothetical protein